MHNQFLRSKFSKLPKFKKGISYNCCFFLKKKKKIGKIIYFPNYLSHLTLQNIQQWSNHGFFTSILMKMEFESRSDHHNIIQKNAYWKSQTSINGSPDSKYHSFDRYWSGSSYIQCLAKTSEPFGSALAAYFLAISK